MVAFDEPGLDGGDALAVSLDEELELELELELLVSDELDSDAVPLDSLPLELDSEGSDGDSAGLAPPPHAPTETAKGTKARPARKR